MASIHDSFLKSLYTQENPLRALGVEAAYVEKTDGVLVIRCNVGDPTGPTLAASNELMSKYYQDRPSGTGYTDHAGDPNLRRIVAEEITRLDRLPKGTFDASKIFCIAGGTGGLNVALSVFNDEDTRVLVTDPYYPPWGPISERNHLKMTRFPLREQDDYLLNEDILREQLVSADSRRPVVLMYHYPHNPTGKTLTVEDAKVVAQTLNKLVREFPNLYLVQEDLYLATVRSDLGIYTPLQHLSPDALEKTILVHSPSKEGHGQDRAALVATPSADIALRLRGSTAFSNLGMSTGALIGTARTIMDIADGIVPRTNENADNHRYVTADYYQDRMHAVGRGFIELEKALGVKILYHAIPEGTYYLWPKLEFLKGMPVPSALQATSQLGPDFPIVSYPETVESSKDIKHMLSRAHHIGLVPVMVTPGEFFTDNNNDMRIRIAAVHRDIRMMEEAANTFLGVIGTTMGLDLNKLGVKTRSLEELRQQFPPRQEEEYVIEVTRPTRAPKVAPEHPLL